MLKIPDARKNSIPWKTDQNPEVAKSTFTCEGTFVLRKKKTTRDQTALYSFAQSLPG